MTTEPSSEPGHDVHDVDPETGTSTGESSSPTAAVDPLTPVIDRFSLEQALLDAEIATTRAHDLALRLVELRAELEAERSRHDALVARAEHAERLYDEIVHNRAYGLATKVWTARRLLGG